MFKIIKYSTIIIIILLSAALTSFAATWTDTVANGNNFNPGNGNQDYAFTYDITGSGDPLNVLSDPSNPFNPGEDLVTSADLLLNFSYGRGNDDSTMDIKLDVNLETLLNFTVAEEDLNLNASAVAQLNNDGTLRLDIHRISGTFELTNSILTATGIDYAQTQSDPPAQPSIPEPSTLLLFGAGILGVGLVRKRITN